MSSWHSPQSIFNLGHRAIKDLFSAEVQIQEKVDGSFFAFGHYPDDEAGYPIKVRSKGAVMSPEAPQAMFRTAVATVLALKDKLHEGWMYRGECLSKPKHCSLAYDRVPVGNVILFDICTSEEDYLGYAELKAEAERLGLETVPQLFHGLIESPDALRKYLDTPSILGGQKIEGVVIKPIIPMYGQDKKLLMGKFVSEAFKEVHREAWKNQNPTAGDIVAQIVAGLKTQTRWDKAIMHLSEQGLLKGEPQDIGLLMKEIPTDILKECEDDIKEALFKYAWKHIHREVSRGFPEYYKQRLLEAQFEKEAQDGVVGNDSVVGVADGVAGVATDSPLLSKA